MHHSSTPISNILQAIEICPNLTNGLVITFIII